MAKLPANVTRLVVGVVVVAIVAVGAYFAFFQSSSDKKVTARFTSAVGIYVGTPVRIIGVNVGSVTGVHPQGDYVRVTMSYDSKYKLGPDAGAVEVANSLVSDRYIQLTPLFDAKRDHGKFLKDGATIDVDHTGGPAELDDIYAALNKLSVALGPKGANKDGALSALLKVSAANLKGNGSALGDSITKLSQAAQTLANQKGDLFGTVRNLQKFTQTLKASDSQIRLFNTQLAQVASDLASERGDLGAALNGLGLALDDVGKFVKQNAGRFHTDIKGLEEITNILVKQKASLNETLAVAPVALSNIVHAYQPDIGAIATRSNLASLSGSSGAIDPTKLVCGLLNLGNIPLPGLCGSAGALPKAGTATSVPGLTVPGLIGGGS
ncbi:MAG: phospholipid/cholesterol/gamma-HCH transport system substrate-binding protein [Pseudonocardiales bacterium]|jgi:phospholipid/cholesterol/gamma-HCH transport system substrate-binding protein|nr:phospholipid/cholesterol/gamma-HCH transport system substrate-binding protein [Pseudonocardiales bacterium]